MSEVKKTTTKKATAEKKVTKAKKPVAKKEDDIVKVDILDVLLDENNKAPIFMRNNKGEQIEFDQVAVIPYGENDLYCILKPITKIPGIKDDEAVVFKVEQDKNGEGYLKVEENEQIAIAVFDQYLRRKFRQ